MVTKRRLAPLFPAVMLPAVLLVLPQFLRPSDAAAKREDSPSSPKVSADAYRSPGSRHKVQVSSPADVAEAQKRGGRLVADYGGYKIFEVDEAAEKALIGSGRADLRDEYNLVMLNVGDIDTTTPEALALRTAGRAATGGPRMHLVQFIGPIRPEWYKALEDTGVRIVTYVPSNAYLVYGDAAGIERARNLAQAGFVQWDGDFRDDYKLHPSCFNCNVDEEAARKFVERRATGGIRPGKSDQDPTNIFAVQLLKGAPTNADTVRLLDAIKLEPFLNQWEILNYRNIVVRLSPSTLKQVAARPDVVSVMYYGIPEMHDERQNMIIAGNLSGNNPVLGSGWFSQLATWGFTQAQFTASGLVVDVSDSGIDNATTNPNHFGLHLNGTFGAGSSRLQYRRTLGTGGTSAGQGCDGHGNINAHIVAGYNTLTTLNVHQDSSGFHYGLGVNPFVKVGNSTIFDPNFTSPNLTNLQSQAYQDGARVSSNSWGSSCGFATPPCGVSGSYNANSQTYDALVRDAQPAGSTFPTAGNQEMTILFSAGNDGTFGAGTVTPSSTAKNVVCVGAAENVHPFGGNDGCGTGDAGANSANDVADFSSRGPCDDGRIKPDIQAPGTHITGGVFQTTQTTSGTGTAGACFDGSGVCGGVGSNFFPSAGQQFFTASSGTSHSCPAAAGGASLIRQFYVNPTPNGLGQAAPPSPAMNKALMMNAARYMNGVLANDTLPSNTQGMGMMNLGTTFLPTTTVPRVLKDQVGADMFTATGQTRTITGNVSTTSQPFRVTLAWTDAPGSTTGNAFNNNLDLEVTVNGQTFRGNVFSGANSATGGVADTRNNVESVFVPAGVSGPFTVIVRATNINSDGVPNVGGALDQDYALVVFNGTETAAPVIAGTGSTITAGNCGSPATAAVDPGETVTVDFTLANIGSATTTNVVATLQASGGITPITTSQNYGALVNGGPGVTRSFQFTANGSCAATVTASLQIQDGASNLGTVQFNFVLGGGATSTIFSQNFDAGTSLPTGWTTQVVSGSVGAWFVATTGADTAPNTAATNGVASVAENNLTSPAISLPAGPIGATLNFRHAWNFENTFDGGVLEVSTNGTTYTDVVTAGGSFVTGGYSGGIGAGTTSPLQGRSAWTNVQSTFITTTVQLPASLNGQNVNIRWRAGWDVSSANTNPNWRVDTVTISVPTCPSCSSCPTITGTPSVTGTNPICTGSSTTVQVAVTGGTPPYTVTLSNGGGTQTGASPLNFTVSPSSTTGYTVSGTDSAACTITGGGTATVTVSQTPTTSNAGPDQTICTSGAATLAANAPSSGTGAWSVVTAPGGGSTSSTQFGNTASPTSTFTPSPAVVGAYTLRWTISNAPCAASTDDVVVTVTQGPTTSNAGPDQTLCVTSPTATLAANTPTNGTGAWSVVTAPGGGSTSSGQFSNTASPTASFTPSPAVAGAYTLRWTISNAPCTASTDDVAITYRAAPTTSNAGPDQTICTSGAATLAANAPSSGTGDWSVVTAPGGGSTSSAQFGNTASPTSTFTPSPAVVGAYTLRWTISNPPCTASTDDVVVTVTQGPTTSNAGPDQTLCVTSPTATLAANTPTTGTGAWSVVTAPGGGSTSSGQFSNTASPTASFTPSPAVAGAYTLRWTISNAPCPASTDDVVMTYNAAPTTSNAGPDQTICTSGSATLAANAPSSGTGAWSVVTTPGGGSTSSAQFGNTASPTSTFTPSPAVAGAYTLRWTISNAPCTASTDDVVLTVRANPTASNAGPDQTLCVTTPATLAANVPGIGAGTWSVVTGPSSATSQFGNVAVNNTTFTPAGGVGTYTLRWTIANAPCAATFDDVAIIFTAQPTTANAGADLTVCLTSTATLGANAPTVGSGSWSVVGGPSSATSQFGNVAVNNTTFTPAGGAGTYTLRWTISNPPCAASTDDVVVTVQTACTELPVLYVADTQNHRVQKFDGATWSVVCGNGVPGIAANQCNLPEAVTASIDGTRIYVADTGNNRVTFSTNGGATWAILASTGIALNQVKAPQGLALDASGNLYVSDTGNNRVVRFNGGLPGTAVVLASSGITAGKVSSPRGLAVSSNNTLFIADRNNNRVLQIAGANAAAVADTGTTVAAGPGIGSTQVSLPEGVGVDDAGNLYVADTGNNRVIQFAGGAPGAGTVMTLGSGGLLGWVSNPEGVTVSRFTVGPFAGQSLLVVGDTGNNRIQGRLVAGGAFQLVGAPNNLGSFVGMFRSPSKIR